MSEKTHITGNKGTKSSTTEFENLLKRADRLRRYVLRLYISGTTLRSYRAIANIRTLCDEYLPGLYDLEVIDIYQQPGALSDDQVVAAPTLIKKSPKPLKRLVGDLSDRDKVIIGLNLVKNKWVGV